MTMSTRPSSLSDADWERLSAYLDGALSASERAQVEARLAHDPAWQAAWAELQAMQQALRTLPAAPRPRGFVLTPDMVRPRPRFWPRWRWAWAALATASAVVLLFMAYGLRVGSLPRLAAQPPPAPALAEAPAEARPAKPPVEPTPAPRAVAEAPAAAEAEAEMEALAPAAAGKAASEPADQPAEVTAQPAAAAQPTRSPSPRTTAPRAEPARWPRALGLLVAAGLLMGGGAWLWRRRAR